MTLAADPADHQHSLRYFRDGAGWSRQLLDLVQATHSTGEDAAAKVAALFSAWPARVAAHLAHIRPAPDWPDGDAPGNLILRMAGTVLQHLPGEWVRRVPQAVPQAWPTGSGGDLQRWCAQLLGQAIQEGQVDWSGVPPLPQGGPGCTVRLLLVDNQLGHGLLGVLQLRCVAIDKAHLALVAAPGSAFTPCTASFRASLDNVTSFLREQLPPAATRNIALAWDIHLPGKPLLLLDGPSAGGAVALAALWLLQDHFRDASQWLPRALARLERSMLDDSAISAALATDLSGSLGPVGGIVGKVSALGSVAGLYRPAHLFVHPEDAQRLELPLPAGLQAHGVGSVLRLARAMALAMDLTPPQQALAGALQTPQPATTQPDSAAASMSAAAAQVATHPGDVRHLDAYALHAWSLWNATSDVGATRCFVPLRLGDFNPGIRGAGQQGAAAQSPLPWLRALSLPTGNRPLEAVLVRGGPGCGKSTWLRQLGAELCEEFVRHGASRQATGVPAPAQAELPIHVPLRHLPHDQDPLVWLRARMQRLYPRCGALHSLLRGETLPGHPTLKLRLLLDGLDELRWGQASKVQRARAVLQSFAQGGLAQRPPVLCARGAHTFDSLLDGGGVRAVDVLAWTPADVREYVQRRCQTGPVDTQLLLDALDRQPWLLELCRTPFHAQVLCSHWHTHPVRATNRAACQRRLLHAALLRELDCETEQGEVAHRNPLFHGNDMLLSEADRVALQNADAWHPEPPAPWPPACGLLNALFRQALAQRLASVQQPRHQADLAWDDHDDPGHSVVHWLPAGLRDLWRQMAHDLGLLAPGAEAGTRFAFHPEWDDHLASVDLLDHAPRLGLALPKNSLRAALQAGRDFVRSDVDDPLHQRQLADTVWREPGTAFWGGLFSQNLRLSRVAVLDALRAEGYTDTMLRAPSDGANAAPAGQWQQAVHDGVVDLDPDADHCVVDLRAWGEKEDLRSRCGLASADDWTTQPAAWRLLMHLLPAPLRDHIWATMGQAQALRLQQHQGLLALRLEGALDRPLAQALLLLDKPAVHARLTWLLRAGLWMALQPAAADLQLHLEGSPENAWTAPDPVLQHLRRVLLLYAIDAGPDAAEPVRQSGQWDLLHQPIDLLPGALQDHWCKVVWPGAFQRHPDGRAGRDLRDRLQAAHMLGALGDTWRYTSAQAATGRGLRLRTALWADIGRPGRTTGFSIGTPGSDPAAGLAEQPPWRADVAHLRAARLLVTVAEWRCFVAAGGYDPAAAHWRQAGAAALRWLQAALARDPRYRPPALDDADWGQALNPMTSITVYEAMAYAAWAAPMYADELSSPDVCQPVLRPPNEVEWEAAQRADAHGQPVQPAGRQADRSVAVSGPMVFNHAATGWQRPSPVGVFSLASSRAGLADVQGNVWEWCVNSLPAGPTGYDDDAGRAVAQATWDAGVLPAPRAVRGGAYHAPAWECRPANRSCANAEDGGSDIGVRLVLVWPGSHLP